MKRLLYIPFALCAAIHIIGTYAGDAADWLIEKAEG